MKKIKLLQITHDLAIGGLQQVVVNICRSINRDKFDVSVLCLRSLGELVPEIESLGIKVTCLLQKNKGTDYLSFLRVAKILRQENIEVIHTHNTQPFVDGTIGALLSGVKTIIHTDHARPFPDKKRYMFAEWAMSHFSHKIVGVSDHTSQNLMEFEKISPKKIVTILNGIDVSRFGIKIDKEKKRRELGLPPKGPVIGLCVRLAEQKGLTYLLRATKDILDRYPDLSLVIAGEGPLEYALQDEAKKYGIDRQVFFLGPRLDIPEILNVLDLYVLPSLWEGLPMVILEAMAAGCPIVASNVGGVPKVITHGENGLLVEPKNIDQLVSSVDRLLRDVDLRLKFSQKNLELVHNKYSSKAMTEQYEQLYLKVL